MTNECIIFFIDSLQNLNEKQLSYIRLFARNNHVLIVPNKTIVSFKELMYTGAYKQYFQFLTKPHHNIHIFFPIGILPLQRIPIIHTINIVFLLVFFSMQLKRLLTDASGIRKKPIVYIVGSEEVFGPHWLYIPGIFKEKLCMYDISHVPSKLKTVQNKQAIYENKLLSYADLVFVQKQSNSKLQKQYKEKIISVPDDPIKKINLVYQAAAKFY